MNNAICSEALTCGNMKCYHRTPHPHDPEPYGFASCVMKKCIAHQNGQWKERLKPECFMVPAPPWAPLYPQSVHCDYKGGSGPCWTDCPHDKPHLRTTTCDLGPCKYANVDVCCKEVP